jgi:hypothetical protein
MCACGQRHPARLQPPSSALYLQAISRDGKWGYADGANIVISPQFDDASPFSEGLAAVREGDSWHFVDENGNRANDRDFVDVKSFAEGLAAVKLGGLWGYIDHSGRMVVSPQFLAARDFRSGLAAVLVGRLPDSGSVPVNRKWGYIDRNGKIVITPRFDDAYPFSEGLARVNIGGRQEWSGDGPQARLTMIEGGKWGYIDPSGKLVIPAFFDWASDFSEGLAAVKMDEAWGYADQSGKFVVTPRFDVASDFYDGKACANMGNQVLNLLKIDGHIVCAGTQPNPDLQSSAPQLPGPAHTPWRR